MKLRDGYFVTDKGFNELNFEVPVRQMLAQSLVGLTDICSFLFHLSSI
jgi:hypothetical protein